MFAQIVRFKSGMSFKEVLAMSEKRAPQYRQIKSLIQKYYLEFADTGEFGAVYLWESKADIAAFRESELGRSIASAYQVKGEPSVQIAEVAMKLRPEP